MPLVRRYSKPSLIPPTLSTWLQKPSSVLACWLFSTSRLNTRQLCICLYSRAPSFLYWLPRLPSSRLGRKRGELRSRCKQINRQDPLLTWCVWSIIECTGVLPNAQLWRLRSLIIGCRSWYQKINQPLQWIYRLLRFTTLLLRKWSLLGFMFLGNFHCYEGRRQTSGLSRTG